MEDYVVSRFHFADAGAYFFHYSRAFVAQEVGKKTIDTSDTGYLIDLLAANSAVRHFYEYLPNR
jgi:hypothetical protein